jgi:hypothetical protein
MEEENHGPTTDGAERVDPKEKTGNQNPQPLTDETENEKDNDNDNDA